MRLTDVPQPVFPPPLRIGSLVSASRYLLSPLAGYTNLSFRRIVRELGGLGLATTDLVNAKGLLAGSKKSLRLIETCPEDRPLSVQIFGSDSAAMRDAAQFLQQHGIDSIDINMGCPVERITKGGSGAGLMCQTDRTVELVRQVVQAVSIPVTVKMRLGWDDERITAPMFARKFEQVGVAAIAIHGRTRAQGFGGGVSLGGIQQVVEAVENIPVIGNGDVRNVTDAARMMAQTGCHGVSIGRGALANPWIFHQLDQWERTGRYEPPGNFLQRLELLRRQLDLLIVQCGIKAGIIIFRRTAHWYLKAMRVRARLRHEFQTAGSLEKIDTVLGMIAEEGPTRGTKTGLLPEPSIPVPSGPIEHW